MADKDVKDQDNFGENLAKNKEFAEKVCSYVSKKVEEVAGNRSYLEKKWVMLERLWRGEPLSRYFRGINATHVPEPWKVIESVVPRMKRALFPSDDWYRVIPTREGKADPRAIKMVLNSQLNDGRFREKITHYIRYCAIMGTQFAKTPWVTDKYTLHLNEPTGEVSQIGNFDSIGSQKATKEIDKSRTELHNLSIYDFIADPRYQDPMKAPFCADRSNQTKEYILQKVEEGEYTNVTAKELDEMLQGSQQEPDLLGKDLREASQALNAIEKEPINNYTITEWWGLLDPDSPTEPKERREFVVTIINGKRCVKVRENGLWHRRRPYILSKWTDVDCQLYGIGLIEVIIRLCMDLNDQASARNMATALLTNPMFLVNDDANIPQEKMISVPGGIVRTRADNVTNSVRPLFMIDQTAASQMRTEEIRRDITEATGTPRSQQGGVDIDNETATAFYGRTQEANVRIKEPAENMGYGALADFLSMMHYNNHQFMKESRAVQITGQADQLSYYEIPPDRLSGEAKFEILMAPQIEMIGVRGQQMLNAIKAFGPEIFSQIPNFKMGKFFRVVWTDLFGHREISDFAPDAEEEMRLSQDEELMVMSNYNVYVDVKEWHPHHKHLAKISQFMMTERWKIMGPEAKAIVNAHAENHVLYVKRNEEKGQQMPQMGGQGRGPAGKTPAVGQGMQSGLQLSENMGAMRG